MELSDALSNFCSENLDKTNDWYNWKFNEAIIPINVNLPRGNHYLRNIALKEELNKAWISESDTAKRELLVKYYIKDWGGIRRISEEKIKIYANSTPESLIELKEKGIASWSKALVIRNPKEYAIFDARVSTSLNCLQIIYPVENKILFPNLVSRNKTITKGQKTLKIISHLNNWAMVNLKTFYRDYLSLLKKVTQDRNTNISTIEMLLFAKAEELVKRIEDFA
ncbi:hypothetical protein [Anaerophaga thermohalophila]|jgi:hypothetical protein|uniref:hypothetical protein n=1 Tax=Anaerophaga thermohalophila TaxID=177400 RepID=UPI0002D582E0|nr:hypothetical protein [Anaerophaga thermohalophila]